MNFQILLLQEADEEESEGDGEVKKMTSVTCIVVVKISDALTWTVASI